MSGRWCETGDADTLKMGNAMPHLERSGPKRPRVREGKNFSDGHSADLHKVLLGFFSLRRGRQTTTKSAATAMHRLVGFNS